MKGLRGHGMMLMPAAAVVMAAAMLAGCSNNGCTENRNAVPLAQFASAATGETISLDSLCISGVDQPGDSVLQPAGPAVSRVYLPMRPTHGSVKWCVAYKWKALDYPELNDTIALDYESMAYFASEECGAYYRYRITGMTTTRHIIESVEIEDSLVTNVDKVYMTIRFRTGEDVQ